MNKKGFTLIEIMGVIVVISLIFLIAIPTILNKVKKGQDTIDESTQNMIISATKDYMSDNINDYPEEIGNVYCIDINDLIDKNYITEDIVTTKDKSILIKKVKVSIDNCSDEYEYKNGTCVLKEDETKTKNLTYKYEVSNSCTEIKKIM